MRMRTSLAPSSRRIALQQDRAAQRVRVPHPLREDVGAAAADGLRRPRAGQVGGVRLRQQRQVVPREALAERAGRSAASPPPAGPGSRRRRASSDVPLRFKPWSPPSPAAFGRAWLSGTRPQRPSAMSWSRGAGAEALAVLRRQPLQHLDREARAEVVEVAEGPAQERREAEAEDRRPRRRRAASAGCRPAGSSTASFRNANTQAVLDRRAASTGRRAAPPGSSA